MTTIATQSTANERGIGLVEVMIALVILVAGALATATMQSTTLISTQASSFHLALEHLGSDVIESIRSHRESILDDGLEYDATGLIAGKGSIASVVKEWDTKVLEAIPNGQGSISCTAVFCNVTISWMEEIDGSHHIQHYKIGTPI